MEPVTFAGELDASTLNPIPTLINCRTLLPNNSPLTSAFMANRLPGTLALKLMFDISKFARSFGSNSDEPNRSPTRLARFSVIVPLKTPVIVHSGIETVTVKL